MDKLKLKFYLNSKSVELKQQKIQKKYVFFYCCFNNLKRKENNYIFLPREIQNIIIEYAFDTNTIYTNTTLYELVLKCKERGNYTCLENIDTSCVTNMWHLFSRCRHFNQSLNNWDVSNVVHMDCMFAECINFNQPLNNWNVSNCKNMSFMFAHCLEFNQNLNTWNVSNAINMSGMFNGCFRFNQPLNNWNVSNCKNMSFMFSDCGTFEQELINWNVGNDVNVYGIFYGCKVNYSFVKFLI